MKQAGITALLMLIIVSSISFSDNNSILLIAAGDILLARLPGKQLLASRNPSFPFTQVRHYFLTSDIAFANLECPISERGTPYPGKPENITFRAPLKALTALSNSGLSILSLANNHSNDYGPQALRDTMEELAHIDIKYCGAGSHLEAASSPAIIVVKGVRFAFFGYAELLWSTKQAWPWASQLTLTRKELFLDKFASTAPFELTPDFTGISAIGNVLADVKKFKARNPTSVIIVSIHWGIEHEHYPRAYQISLAHDIIDAGATIILGHHPHVLQGIEIYNKGIIVYSMGNFVFDMASDETYKSALFQFRFTGTQVDSISIIPVQIDRRNYSPAPAYESAAQKILTDIQTYSQKLGTRITIANDQAYINLNKNK